MAKAMGKMRDTNAHQGKNSDFRHRAISTGTRPVNIAATITIAIARLVAHGACPSGAPKLRAALHRNWADVCLVVREMSSRTHGPM
jgi:hypothetical protein